MQNMVYALENMIPISLFNRGQAGKIFSEVKKGISKVVIKNNEPEAVLLSPQEYKRLMDMAEDYELIQLTLERLEQEDFSKTISGKDMMSELGITQEEIEYAKSVSITDMARMYGLTPVRVGHYFSIKEITYSGERTF